jgi:hypothetical protein
MTRNGFLERLRKFALRFELKGLLPVLLPGIGCAAALVLVFR